MSEADGSDAPVRCEPNVQQVRAHPTQGRSVAVGLAVVLTATFLGQFDFFVVNVAGPTIRTDLHADDAALEMIVGGYAFAYAAGLITTGRLGDLLGYRRMFITGITAFGLASLLCGISQTPTQLVLARLAQGTAASVMLPQVLAYITATIAPARRATAIAWYGVAAGVGSICGQVLGGVLVQGDDGPGWRLIFLINLPIALLAGVLARLVLPGAAARTRAQFDPYGALGLTAALAALLLPLTLGPGDGWRAWTGWSLAAVPLLAILTAQGERRVAGRGGAPIVPPRLLRLPTFTAGMLAAAAFMLFFPSFMFTLTLLLQEGLLLDPLEAGLVFVPAGVTFSVGALCARSLYGRFGIAAPLTGCAVTTAALALLVAENSAHDSGASAVTVALCAAVMSLGNGVVSPTLTSIALSDVPIEIAGAASGLIATVQQFASAAGVALIGSVFFAATDHAAGAAGPVYAATISQLVDIALLAAVAVSLLVVHRTAGLRPR